MTQTLERQVDFVSPGEVILSPPEVQTWTDGHNNFKMVEVSIPDGPGAPRFYRRDNKSATRLATEWLDLYSNRPDGAEADITPVVVVLDDEHKRGTFYDARGGQAHAYDLQQQEGAYRQIPGTEVRTGKDVPVLIAPNTKVVFGWVSPRAFHERSMHVEQTTPPANVALYLKLTEAVDTIKRESGFIYKLRSLLGRTAVK